MSGSMTGPTDMEHRQTPSTSTGTENKLQAKIRCEQVRLLYEELQISIFSSLGVAAVLVLALWDVIEHAALLIWLGALIILSIGRLWMASMYWKREADASDTQSWFLRFTVGAALSGLLWGSASFFLMPAESIGHQLLLTFILGGLMAGATQSLSPVMAAYVVFCLPTALPVILRLFMLHTPVGPAMGLLFALFAFALFFIARNLNKVLAESFRLRFENTDLIANLKDEVATRKMAEDKMRRHNAILEMLESDLPLTDILNAINQAIEEEDPSAKSSILLLDEDGKQLFNASAPSLPDDFTATINGAAIGPSTGSCGTAAYKNEMVIVEDIASDPLWADYKELALAHGLQACWSMPIRNAASKVLGTFALYYKLPRKPTTMEIELIQSAAYLAGIAIERYRTARKLEQMAHYDALTLLPNRSAFITRFEQALAQSRRNKQLCALLFIDLDDFKDINDTHGHEAGDSVLQEVANRLRACLREVDTPARLGGDEFTLILTELHNSKDAALVAGKVIEALSQSIEPEGRDMSIGCSIGISLFPDDGEDVDTLIAKSDTAMYQAKQKGGNTWKFYSQARQ
jgi:diguanylate cyclase (GGDEF)-like protein